MYLKIFKPFSVIISSIIIITILVCEIQRVDANTLELYSNSTLAIINPEELRPRVDKLSDSIPFRDKELEKIIRYSLNKWTGDVLKGDIARIKMISGEGGKIQNIDALRYFDNVTYLDLNGNRINSYKSIAFLDNLERLYLSNTSLESNDLRFLMKLKNPQNLNCLDVSNLCSEHGTHLNNVKDISMLKRFVNIEYLRANGNSIKNIDVIKNLNNIVGLELNNNPISDFEPISYLPKLEVLYLEGMNIQNIDFLRYYTNLKELDLSNNHINDIEPLKDLTKLEILKLNNNHITNIENISNLQELQKLDLKNNIIVNIKPLSNLKKLKSLRLSE